MRATLCLAAVAGFLAVIAGTFAAHVLDGRLPADRLDAYEIGVRYHAYHALALLACAGVVERLGRGARVAVWLFVGGIIVFSGSLYLLAFTGERWLGAITPIGGAAFLAGWATLAIAALRRGA